MVVGGGGGGGSYSGLLKSKGDGGTSSVTTVADEKAVVLVWEWDSGPAPACEMIRWVMQGGSVRERDVGFGAAGDRSELSGPGG